MTPAVVRRPVIVRCLGLLTGLLVLAGGQTDRAQAAPPPTGPIGTAVGWGYDADGRATPDPDLGPATAIASGVGFSLALLADGTVTGWGLGTYGETSVPAGLDDVVDLDGGYFFAAALRSDGSVVSWGEPYYSQAPVLTDAVDVAAGGYVGFAVRRDGQVVTWGASYETSYTVPSDLHDVVAVDAGIYHALALRSDGTVRAWGSNSSGQTDVPAGLDHVVAVSAGGFHSLALKSDGTVVGWGYDASGQASPPPGLRDVVAVSAGSYWSMALRADGTVVAWGDDSSGEVTQASGLARVTAIAAGGYHGVALVGSPPTITADGASTATVGIPYSAAGAVTGLPAPRVAVTAGSLPPGLTLDPGTGTLSGTPTTAGTWTWTVTADNGAPPAATRTTSITVLLAPRWTAAGPTPGTTASRGTEFGYAFTATGSPNPTYAVVAGTPPPGLTLDAATGVLSGTATAAGSWTFTVRASNAAGTTDTTVTLVVPEELAITGAPADGQLALGGALLVSGVALLLLGRRRIFA